MTITSRVTLGVGFWSNVHLTVLDWVGPGSFSAPPIVADPLINWSCQNSPANFRTDCTTSIPVGTPYTLTPAPEGIIFKGWSGACAGDGVCALSTTEPDVNPIARFAVGLTVQVSGGGSAVESADSSV